MNRDPGNISTSISDFMARVATGDTEIYNEFSLQHEIGIYLRNKLGDFKVQFERNVSYFGFDKQHFEKREIDISVFSAEKKNLKLAIELKFPRNGQYPEQMFSFCKDIVFLEQLRAAGFHRCIFIAVADDRLFYEGSTNGIYSYFRGGEQLHGDIVKPTGKRDKILTVQGHYEVSWKPIKGATKYTEIHVNNAV
jgi:hypothetical protein